MSKMLPYRLEFHDRNKGLIKSFESPTPFMGISVGDTIGPHGWGDAAPKTLLRVTHVEHRVYGDDDVPFHAVVVYTEPR